MKELSIKEKAKAYDEIVARAKKYLEDCPDRVDARDCIEHLVPELAESEDERIRKALIKLVKKAGEGYENVIDGVSIENAISWLEKQGERKPAYKVEPKFHEGEWVFIEEVKGYKNGPFKIKTVDSFGYSFDEYHTIPFMYEDLLSKWTIQDAKDGDVLCYKDEISLYEHDIKNVIKQEPTFGGFAYHCCYDSKRFITNSLYSLTEQDKMDIHPATKEQRDLLFQKMREKGYEWDAKKKELKKIEQNPAWSEEDEDAIGMAIIALDDMYTPDEPDNTYAGYSMPFNKAVERLKSLKDRVQLQNTWKPSEEQIIALRWVLSKIPYNIHKEEISGLLDQIKDL